MPRIHSQPRRLDDLSRRLQSDYYDWMQPDWRSVSQTFNDIRSRIEANARLLKSTGEPLTSISSLINQSATQRSNATNRSHDDSLFGDDNDDTLLEDVQDLLDEFYANQSSEDNQSDSHSTRDVRPRRKQPIRKRQRKHAVANKEDCLYIGWLKCRIEGTVNRSIECEINRYVAQREWNSSDADSEIPLTFHIIEKTELVNGSDETHSVIQFFIPTLVGTGSNQSHQSTSQRSLDASLDPLNREPPSKKPRMSRSVSNRVAKSSAPLDTPAVSSSQSAASTQSDDLALSLPSHPVTITPTHHVSSGPTAEDVVEPQVNRTRKRRRMQISDSDDDSDFALSDSDLSHHVTHSSVDHLPKLSARQSYSSASVNRAKKQATHQYNQPVRLGSMIAHPIAVIDSHSLESHATHQSILSNLIFLWLRGAVELFPSISRHLDRTLNQSIDELVHIDIVINPDYLLTEQSITATNNEHNLVVHDKEFVTHLRSFIQWACLDQSISAVANRSQRELGGGYDDAFNTSSGYHTFDPEILYKAALPSLKSGYPNDRSAAVMDQLSERGLITTSRQYQLEAIDWLIKCEQRRVSDDRLLDEISDLWKPFAICPSVIHSPKQSQTLHQTQCLYLNVATGQMSTSRAVYQSLEKPSHVAGGILADSMGLGKSLCLVGLILLNPACAQSVEVPTISESSVHCVQSATSPQDHMSISFSAPQTTKRSHNRTVYQNLDVSIDPSLQRDDFHTVSCYCGDGSQVSNKQFIQCDICYDWQHSTCVGFTFATKETGSSNNDSHDQSDGIEYVCPSCEANLATHHSIYQPLKATLVVVPDILIDQWADEIQKHIRISDNHLDHSDQQFRVLVYKGCVESQADAVAIEKPITRSSDTASGRKKRSKKHIIHETKREACDLDGDVTMQGSPHQSYLNQSNTQSDRQTGDQLENQAICSANPAHDHQPIIERSPIYRATQLIDYDIILISFSTLRSESSHLMNQSISQTSHQVGQTIRIPMNSSIRHSGDHSRLRNKKKYRTLPSPLTQALFHRISIDESQQLTEDLFTYLSSYRSNHQTILSGTPFLRGYDELIGILRFMKVWPYCQLPWFRRTIMDDQTGPISQITTAPASAQSSTQSVDTKVIDLTELDDKTSDLPVSQGMDQAYSDLAGSVLIGGSSEQSHSQPIAQSNHVSINRSKYRQLEALARRVMWRNTNQSINQSKRQLDLPPLTEKKILLKFSPVEQYFYESINQSISQSINQSSNLSIKSIRTINQQFVRLRQSCNHPQLANSQSLNQSSKRSRRGKKRTNNHSANPSNKQSSQRRVLTMDEITELLMKKCLSDCLNDQRSMIASLNGLAGIMFLINQADNQSIKQAIRLYSTILDITVDIFDCSIEQSNAALADQSVKGVSSDPFISQVNVDRSRTGSRQLPIDRLQECHALYNLAQAALIALESFHPTEQQPADATINEDDSSNKFSRVGEFLTGKLSHNSMSSQSSPSILPLTMYQPINDKITRFIYQFEDLSGDSPSSQDSDHSVIQSDKHSLIRNRINHLMDRVEQLKNGYVEIINQSMLRELLKFNQQHDEVLSDQQNICQQSDESASGTKETDTEVPISSVSYPSYQPNMSCVWLFQLSNVLVDQQMIESNLVKKIKLELTDVDSVASQQTSNQSISNAFNTLSGLSMIVQNHMEELEQQRKAVITRLNKLINHSVKQDSSSHAVHHASQLSDDQSVIDQSDEHPDTSPSEVMPCYTVLDPSKQSIELSVNCSKCRPEARGPECEHCAIDRLIRSVETLMYSRTRTREMWVQENQTIDGTRRNQSVNQSASLPSDLLDSEIDSTSSQYEVENRSPHEVEVAVTTIQAFARSNVWLNNQSSNRAISSSLLSINQSIGDQLSYLQSVKQEMLAINQLVIAHRNHLSAYDEIDMCLARLTIDKPIIPSDSQSVSQKQKRLNLISKSDIPFLINQNMDSYTSSSIQLRQHLRSWNFLKTQLSNNQSICIICQDTVLSTNQSNDQSKLAAEIGIFDCFHQFCSPCIRRLISRSVNRITNQTVNCPICRSKQPISQIKYAATQSKDSQSSTQPVNHSIKGSWSTKLTGLVSLVLSILSTDAQSINQSSQDSTKILIFSEWIECLHLINQCLADNGISSKCLIKKSDYHSILHEFQTDEAIPQANKKSRGKSINQSDQQSSVDDGKSINQSVSCLLLPTMKANHGLNLARANHIIFVDQSIDQAIDRQCIGRIYRMGQTKEMFVHRLIIDQSIESILHNQSNHSSIDSTLSLSLEESMCHSTNQSSSSSSKHAIKVKDLSTEEIIDLILSTSRHPLGDTISTLNPQSTSSSLDLLNSQSTDQTNVQSIDQSPDVQTNHSNQDANKPTVEQSIHQSDDEYWKQEIIRSDRSMTRQQALTLISREHNLLHRTTQSDTDSQSSQSSQSIGSFWHGQYISAPILQQLMSLKATTL